MKTNWLLEYHFVRGDYTFCKKIIQDVSKKNDDRQREYATYIQARIYSAEGKVQEGLQLFQACYSQNLNNPEYLQEIAKCLIAQARYKKAIEALTHAKRLMTKPDFLLLIDLAQCHVNLKEYGLAEESCKEAIRICRSKAIYKLLAACLIHQNKMSEAIEVFRQALRLYPKSSQLYTSFGQLCAQMNFEEDALKTLSAAIKLNDSNVIALNELALMHQKRSEFEDAIKFYREILHRDEESACVYNNLGLCYFYKDKFVLALTCLLKARDIDPVSSETLFNLGLIFASLHQYCSAAVHWKATAVYAPKGNSSEEQELSTLLSTCMKTINEGTTA